MSEYQKPSGFRFQNGGMNLRYTPDALTPNKYVLLRNVRETSDLAIQTRPGYSLLFTTPNHNPITDIKSYATLGTDAAPRFLARDTANIIYLDNGTTITNIAGTPGNGVTMMPFRPNASFQSWMYIAGVGDYRKFSAPSSNVVTTAKVGTQEAVIPIEFAPQTEPKVVDITSLASGWTAGGTAAAPTFSATLLADNSAGGAGGPDGTNYAVIADPVVSTRWSVGVATNYYLPGMLVTINTSRYIIASVLQPIPQTTIAAIRYDSASFGACNIIFNQDLSTILDRGSILVVDNGVNKEAIFVQSVIPGVSGAASCQIRTSTVNTYAAGNNVFGELTIVVSPIGGAGTPSGQITIQDVTSSITVGVGTLSQNFTIGTLGGFTSSDYVHLALFSQNGWSQAAVTIIFNVGVSGNFTNSILSLPASILSTSGQSILINVPISAFNPGTGLTVSSNPPNTNTNLASAVGVQISINNTGPTTVFGIIGFWVAGQGGPDVGYVNQSFKNSGAPYRYTCVPRASTTGVVGNPGALPFYGVNPHRSTVLVKTSNLIITGPGDTQCDTIDVYRSGGSVTSFQYIGSVAAGNDFVDNVTDAGASAGQPLQFDNFEPWPSIDIPFSGNSGIDLKGTTLRLNIASPPATILSWLPGTLFTLTGIGTFTLRTRPVLVTGTTYQFEFTQNAGTTQPTNVVVNEPIVANQHLPFIAGPDANGFFWAVGDPLRPGTAYFSKAYQPDSAPQINTFELCPPSEPLIGVEIIRGVTYICSTKRWWAMYPNAQFTSTPVPPLFNPVEQAIGETFAAGWGHTSNGVMMAYWGKRGIYITDGNAAKSITDADLLPLFPHDGIAGIQVGPFFPPDYAQSSQFRLNFVGNYLYADYVDTVGTHITLVYNIKSSAWVSNDVYNIPMLTHYAHEQPEGALSTSTLHLSYANLGVLGGRDGNVYVFTPNHNDNAANISCTVQTFEWDGGDARADMQFGDGWIDCVPQSAISIKPTSLGNPTSPTSTIVASVNRTLTPFAVGQQTLQKFMGINLSWTDNFSLVTAPTTLITWQLACAAQAESIVDRATDYYNLNQASNVRGVILDLDTFSLDINIQFVTEYSLVAQTLTVNHNGRKEVAYAFQTPFIAHLIKLVPPAKTSFPTPNRWRLYGVKFIADPWPELAQMSTPWLTAGQGTQYIRGAVIPLDTNGVTLNLTFLSSDNNSSTTVSNLTTTAGQKTAVAMAFNPPLVAHQVQITPNKDCRIWEQEIVWHADPYPELTPEFSPIMLMTTGDNSYVQGIKLTADSNNLPVGFNVLGDGGTIVATIPATAFNGKTTIPFVFPTPFLAHNWQLQPLGNIRVFTQESKWIYQPTPESMTQWGPTQFTSHGLNGYHFLYRLEAAYTATAPVTLTVTSFDGTSPQPLILPSTAGATQKIILTFTANKGTMFKYQTFSAGNHQLFLQDWRLILGQWGQDLKVISNLGGLFGDKAEI